MFCVIISAKTLEQHTKMHTKTSIFTHGSCSATVSQLAILNSDRGGMDVRDHLRPLVVSAERRKRRGWGGEHEWEWRFAAGGVAGGQVQAARGGGGGRGGADGGGARRLARRAPATLLDILQENVRKIERRWTEFAGARKGKTAMASVVWGSLRHR